MYSQTIVRWAATVNFDHQGDLPPTQRLLILSFFLLRLFKKGTATICFSFYLLFSKASLMGPSGTERNALSILTWAISRLRVPPMLLIYGTLTHQSSWRNEEKEIEQVQPANETKKTNTSNSIGKGDPMHSLNAYEGLHAHSLEHTRRRTKRDNKHKECSRDPKLKSQ